MRGRRSRRTSPDRLVDRQVVEHTEHVGGDDQRRRPRRVHGAVRRRVALGVDGDHLEVVHRPGQRRVQPRVSRGGQRAARRRADDADRAHPRRCTRRPGIRRRLRAWRRDCCPVAVPQFSVTPQPDAAAVTLGTASGGWKSGGGGTAGVTDAGVESAGSLWTVLNALTAVEVRRAVAHRRIGPCGAGDAGLHRRPRA